MGGAKMSKTKEKFFEHSKAWGLPNDNHMREEQFVDEAEYNRWLRYCESVQKKGGNKDK